MKSLKIFKLVTFQLLLALPLLSEATELKSSVNENLLASDQALSSYVEAYKNQFGLTKCILNVAETMVTFKESSGGDDLNEAEFSFSTDINCFKGSDLVRVIYVQGELYNRFKMFATKIEQYSVD